MRFGGNQLPMRLRVARTILYCQAAIMVLIAALFSLQPNSRSMMKGMSQFHPTFAIRWNFPSLRITPPS